MNGSLRGLKRSEGATIADAPPDLGQGRWLAQVIRGYFVYHAVPTNCPALSAFRHHIRRLWLRTPRHRSRKDPSHGSVHKADQSLPPSPMAERSLCRHSLAVGAVCLIEPVRI
jgi:hypothetical protein